MKQEYGNSRIGRSVIVLTLIAIVTGCAAFEAGNILGAVAGISIISDQIPDIAIVLIIGMVAAVLLWKGTITQIATLLGFIVALMGICFVVTAFMIPHDFSELIRSGLTPVIPVGAELLVLGLIGTTVVPYNIFLGSGLKHAQTPSEMKISMMIAIGLGGFVSVAILLTGTAIAGSFSFEALSEALSNQLGAAGPWLLGIGLLGAGLSSALTAALAAAITAKSLLITPENREYWAETGIRFKAVWGLVLGIGLLFGTLNLQPVPIIILAQALNGIILPVIAVILFLLMNNDRVLPKEHQNGLLYNAATSVVVFLTILIGITNLFRALSRIFEFDLLNQTVILVLSVVIFTLLTIPIGKKILLNRTNN
jgi:manganese transport protein